MRVEVYSDVVCPWCYIGERRFDRALEAFAGSDEVEVVFRPYQLDPDAPETAVPLKEYLEGRYGPRVSGMLAQADQAAAGEGLEIAWDRALSVNTRTAHRLMRLAETEYGAEVQRDLADRLFELHFVRGGDVSDHEELADAASAVGMDRERVRAYLDSEEGVREVEEEIAAARNLGVRAVPTFVFDGEYAVQGAQPASAFLQALEKAAENTAAAAASDAGAGACEDGVCKVDL